MDTVTFFSNDYSGLVVVCTPFLAVKDTTHTVSTNLIGRVSLYRFSAFSSFFYFYSFRKAIAWVCLLHAYVVGTVSSLFVYWNYHLLSDAATMFDCVCLLEPPSLPSPSSVKLTALHVVLLSFLACPSSLQIWCNSN